MCNVLVGGLFYRELHREIQGECSSSSQLNLDEVNRKIRHFTHAFLTFLINQQQKIIM
jgi:hypothetical protein